MKYLLLVILLSSCSTSNSSSLSDATPSPPPTDKQLGAKFYKDCSNVPELDMGRMFCAYTKVMEYCAPKEETVTLNGEKYLLLNQREMCIQAFIMANKNK